MAPNDFLALLPLLILSIAAVLVMMLIVANQSHRVIQMASLFLFLTSFLSLFLIPVTLPYAIAPLLLIDSFGVYMMALIVFSALVVNIISYVYFEGKEEGPKEYYVLLFLCTLGACILAVSQHFVSLFLGLEILTIGLYALIAYLRSRQRAIEAGIKYLILAAFSSAFLLFGMALIYVQTGSMSFSLIAHSLALETDLPALFLLGIGMMMVGIGFKLAIVPFHMWAADVYQGAPLPVTAFIATASKGGVLAVTFRFLTSIDGLRFHVLSASLVVLAMVSILLGNILALQQKNLKRLLAYSSIAHFGYLLVAFVPNSPLSLPAMSFYLSAYLISTLAAFGIMAVRSDGTEEAEELASYTSLFWQSPLQASILGLAMLSLAGIPLTVGFTGKFYLLAAAIQNNYWALALVLVLGSILGIYYYLRVINSLLKGGTTTGALPKTAFPYFLVLSLVMLSLLALFILGLGVFPESLIGYLKDLQMGGTTSVY
ncbi:NADH-quinone oxidoreductase subunit N [Dyadobacter jejuensis]|uniref:NADH-quinone oxidoreductase subunit N n=1 Tax=Dyadobacter jejuensis TaxID=1082580 RepID=A0A316AQR4_9BACT|nr:NADH-quinone oxidoreductase subunit N [Dyadobacter jejuensis]PWJ60085.1 NADH-quinone oxidoreductase subunit N [Dyadobacter jejuensis]